MSSRVQEKEAARKARLEAEAQDATLAARARRIRVLGALALVVVVIVVVAVIAAGGGSGSSGTKTGRTGGQATKTAVARMAGIPQHGFTLGSAGAKATVEEFLDPQCPFCAQFSHTGLPVLLRDYVRTGKVKLVMRPLSFIGPDSVRGGRAVAAAAQQDRAWTFLEVLYAHQGEENTGYMTDTYLRGIAKQVPGLDVDAVVKAADATGNAAALGAANTRANIVGVNATPSLVLTKPGGSPQKLNISSSDYAGTTKQALDAALRG